MGAKLLHQGQFEGLNVRLPVFLARRRLEQINHDLVVFYDTLLQVINREVFKNGEWLLCERNGWPDNSSFKNILTWCWRDDNERYLIIVNFSHTNSQALIRVPWDELKERMWDLKDVLSGDFFERSGNDMLEGGLYIDLGPWKYHFFRLSS